jgi:NAD(P)-dependent dehydrogenase (short-subunit alcohol dehydrogenase family)
MNNRLTGKTAIITGASMGIGAAIAELFSQEGASVVLTARREQPLKETVNKINAAGGKALGIPIDVKSGEDCKGVFAKAIKFFGPLDIMVNNAGIAELHSIESTNDELWNNIMMVNLNNVFYYCREAIQHFIPRNQGVIINVSSANGLRPVAGFAYSATKAAVNSITKSIALRFTKTNIRCNAICPGPTETPMMQANYTSKTDCDDILLDNMVRHIDMTIPYAEAIDQAYAALFLASDEAKAITGVTLAVDKGSYI